MRGERLENPNLPSVLLSIPYTVNSLNVERNISEHCWPTWRSGSPLIYQILGILVSLTKMIQIGILPIDHYLNYYSC